MDYMKELNAFRNWQLINQLSTGEVALWYTLMSINNMTGWAEWFQAPNSTVQLLTGLSKQGIDKARLKLSQKGLIEYRKGSKGTAGYYKMLSLVSQSVNNNAQKVDQSVDQSGDNQLTDMGTDSAPDGSPLIDKDIDRDREEDKTKQQELTAKVFKIYEQEGFGTLSSFAVDYLNDLIDTYTANWVIRAMYESVKAGKRQLRYVEGILKNWKAQGIDEPWEKDSPNNETDRKRHRIKAIMESQNKTYAPREDLELWSS